jgi:hypothetical protein
MKSGERKLRIPQLSLAFPLGFGKRQKQRAQVVVKTQLVEHVR